MPVEHFICFQTCFFAHLHFQLMQVGFLISLGSQEAHNSAIVIWPSSSVLLCKNHWYFVTFKGVQILVEILSLHDF